MAAPVFTVVTPVYDPPERLLRACIESVRGQTFERWEWRLVDDGSRDPRVRAILEEAAASDPRVHVTFREANGGIVAATNDGVAAASAPWLAFLDNDDRLVPTALARVAEVVEAVGDVDYIYSDEELVDEGGRTLTRFEKPGWSPARLRAQMYCGHLSVMRTSVVRELGGLRPGYDGSQDYDLALRVSERARRIVHIPQVLYQWVQTAGSTAGDAEAKPWAYDAGVRAVQDHCDRLGLRADVEATAVVGVHRIRRRRGRNPLVSIVIPTRGTSGDAWGEPRCHVVEAVRSIIRRSTYPAYEIVVVADADTPPAVLDELRAVAGRRLTLVPFAGAFNFARKSNLGAIRSEGDRLVFLNDDTEVVSPDWIETLLGPLEDGDVGLTGANLIFPDGLVQHAGQCMNVVPQHVLYRFPARAPGPMSAMLVERECSGVTAACSMLRRDIFLAIGGFTEALPSNYNDVDMCLKIRHAGMRIVWVPDARLWHFESASRDPKVTAHDLEFMEARWHSALRSDPYFTPSTADVGGYEQRSWR